MALTTESAARLSPLRRAPVASVYTFDVQGGAEVAAVVGIPGDALTPRQEGDVFRYAIPATFSIEYASGHVVRTDTLLELRSPQPLRQEALVPLTMALRTADPDSVTARITVRDGGREGAGQMLVSLVDVRAAGEALGMSDIVIADGRTTLWTQGDVSFGPIPGHNIAGGMFAMYYELYNTRPDDELRTSIIVAPGSGSGLGERLRQWVRRRQAMSLSFEEVASPGVDGTVRVLRELRAELEAGLHEITVRIENRRTGEAVQRTTSLRIH